MRVERDNLRTFHRRKWPIIILLFAIGFFQCNSTVGAENSTFLPLLEESIQWSTAIVDNMIETKNVEKLFKGNPKLGSFTVGAVNVISPYTSEPYSSHGPTYGPGGTPTGGIIKPDIVGYANVSTESYGVGKFSGTSAATPHISGVATLIKEAYPGYSVSQLQSLLEDRAIDQGVSGKDNEYGSGRLYLGSPRRDDIFIRGDNNWASLLTFDGASFNSVWIVEEWIGSWCLRPNQREIVSDFK